MATPALLAELLARRCTGEPLAWLVGSVQFCGQTVLVEPGVYVPRWQSEPMARAAVALLPENGTAVDLCTGSGAIAVVLSRQRPHASVLATDIDPRPWPVLEPTASRPTKATWPRRCRIALPGEVDVVVAVVPYVPTDELQHLPRDVVAFEPLRALDGGPQGIDHLISAVRAGAGLLKPGGSLLLELGGDEATLLMPALRVRLLAP